MISCLLFYLIFLQEFSVIAQDRLSSHGSFFHKIKDLNEDKNKSDSTTISQEFFACDRSSSCEYLIAAETTKEYNTTTQQELIEAESNVTTIWKKDLQGDCKGIYNSGIRTSGIYSINISSKAGKLKVFCDMETDGGGWTVIQRRVDNSTNFNRNWNEYKNGFGNLQNNLWLGLENMHSLAGPGRNGTLRIELKHYLKGETLFYAKYAKFEIKSEADGYSLQATEYSGTAGDAFNVGESTKTSNGMKFSTNDRRNGPSTLCAPKYKSGWWFKSCFNTNLNGPFPIKAGASDLFMTWNTINNDYGNIYFSEMKVRRG